MTTTKDILTAIYDALETQEARDWWHGAASDIRNEMLIYAQEHGAEAAAREVEGLSEEPADA